MTEQSAIDGAAAPGGNVRWEEASVAALPMANKPMSAEEFVSAIRSYRDDSLRWVQTTAALKKHEASIRADERAKVINECAELAALDVDNTCEGCKIDLARVLGMNVTRELDWRDLLDEVKNLKEQTSHD